MVPFSFLKKIALHENVAFFWSLKKFTSWNSPCREQLRWKSVPRAERTCRQQGWSWTYKRAQYTSGVENRTSRGMASRILLRASRTRCYSCSWVIQVPGSSHTSIFHNLRSPTQLTHYHPHSLPSLKMKNQTPQLKLTHKGDNELFFLNADINLTTVSFPYWALSLFKCSFLAATRA